MKQDLKAFSDGLRTQLQEKLNSIALEATDFTERSVKSMNEIKNILEELRAFIEKYPLQSDADEVLFFKVIKPIYSCQYLYHDRIFKLKLHEPIADPLLVETYYRDELAQLERYLKKHAEFYGYYLSGSSQFDKLYFTRNVNFSNPEMDRFFSTGFDQVLARILSINMLKDFITDTLNKLHNKQDPRRPQLSWTGSKTSLVELVYALQTVDAINNGEAEVKQIATLFEEVFNVSLGNYYRVLQDIRLRKNNQTNFLDQLKQKFVQRLDDMN